MKIRIMTCVFAFALTAFTVFAALDTFVISRVYQMDASDENMFRQSEAALAEAIASQENADAGPFAEQDDNNKELSENEEQETSVENIIMQENAVTEDAAQQDETGEEGAAKENNRTGQNDNMRRGSSSGDSNNTEDTDNDGSF